MVVPASITADVEECVAAALELLSLTRQEKGIVARLLRGQSNKQIASELGIHQQTVKDHLQSVYGKLGVCNRTELLAWFYRRCIENVLAQGR